MDCFVFVWFFLIHTLNSIPPLWPNPSPWAHDFKKTWIYNTWEFFFEKLSFLIQKVFSLNSFLKVDHPIVAHSAPGEHDMNNFETTLLEDVSTDAFLAQWFMKENCWKIPPPKKKIPIILNYLLYKEGVEIWIPFALCQA